LRTTGPRLNERIRITPVRLIDENGDVVGVVETDDARARARDLGLDLVEMSADSRPPVCRIMDYGRYKYEQSKKDRANKAKTKVAELKEVRLGRSMKIDPHDVLIRMKQARKFLIDGHRVQIVQNFRGREMAMRSRGNDRLNDIIQQLDDVSKVEMHPRMNGRRMSMILAPDKVKIAAYKRALEKEGKTLASQTEATAAEQAAVETADAALTTTED
jgi:translation initiation factor IF-3